MMRSKLKAVFFPSRRQVGQIHEQVMDYALLDDNSLIDKYNVRARCGLFGNQSQWIDTVGMALALKQRFGDPVVHYVDGELFCPCTVELSPEGVLVKTAFSDWE